MIRGQPTPRWWLRIGAWEVYPSLDRIARDAGDVHLEPRVMDVLVFFAERPGEVVPRAVILDAVWTERYVADAVLTRAVAVLRKALGDNARDPRYIETIPKRGYRLIAPVDRPPRRLVVERQPRLVDGNRPDVTLLVDDREIDLDDGEYVIGRAVDADVRIPASDISRRHALVTVRGHRVIVEDLGSKNGTWMAGTRLTVPTQLTDGDHLVLGSRSVGIHVRYSTSTQTAPGWDPDTAEMGGEPTPPRRP